MTGWHILVRRWRWVSSGPLDANQLFPYRTPFAIKSLLAVPTIWWSAEYGGKGQYWAGSVAPCPFIPLSSFLYSFPSSFPHECGVIKTWSIVGCQLTNLEVASKEEFGVFCISHEAHVPSLTTSHQSLSGRVQHGLSAS
ncbi:hypothetical protein E2C01_090264 [Portunus trituberculatus]|uniref:Uncharacterized protein n=1 Tax=Portunus trituberculatus TaxID=210409 RepID=A0A5B7JJT0_PORTR|nr:hypothetical protein [Portunus trituberculatus]